MLNLSVPLTGGGDQSKRRELDYYPAPTDVTVALMDFLRLNLKVKIKNVWEPACGDGQMSKVIESYGLKVISTDIRLDSTYGQGGVDYLIATAHHRPDAIITNPPFCVAEDFIRKACAEAGVVCMLLKSQYWHAKSRVSLFRDNPPAYILPLTWRPDFLAHLRQPGEKGSPTMEVAWTVWIKGDQITKYHPLVKAITK